MACYIKGWVSFFGWVVVLRARSFGRESGGGSSVRGWVHYWSLGAEAGNVFSRVTVVPRAGKVPDSRWLLSEVGLPAAGLIVA